MHASDRCLLLYPLLPQAGEGLGMRGYAMKKNVTLLNVPHPSPLPPTGEGRRVSLREYHVKMHHVSTRLNSLISVSPALIISTAATCMVM